MYFHFPVKVTFVQKISFSPDGKRIFKNQLYQIHEQKIKITSIIYK